MILKEAKIECHLGHYSDQTEISAAPQVSQPVDRGRGQKTNQASKKPKTTTNNNKIHKHIEKLMHYPLQSRLLTKN